jgi:MYXO-CTERM domain-containing protein
MTSDGDGTKIVITTDLKVTGKVAQFGRGVMADVSEKLIGQFVESLEQKLVESNEREVATPTTSESDSATADDDAIEDNSGPRKVNMPEPEPVDLLDTAGAPLFKRFGPFALVALVLVLLRRRKRS